MDVFLSEPVIDLLSVMPFEVVMTYLYSKLLTIRRVGLFWVVRLAVLAVLVFVRSSLDPFMRTSMGIVAYFIIPFLFAQDKITRRLFILLMVYVLVMVVEFTCQGLWYIVTGLPIADYDVAREHLVQFALLHLIHLILTAALIGALLGLIRRHAREGSSRDMLVFSGFPAVQVMLLTIALMIKVYVAPENDSMYLGLFLVVIVFFVADVVLFNQIDRYQKKLREEERAAMLAGELDIYLERYREVVDGVEAVARLRHDLRNQVQVAAVLIEQGETARAQEHLEHMIDVASETGASR